MAIYAADLETTTKRSDCREWAVALMEVGNTENFWLGKTVKDLILKCSREKNMTTLYFHNLKF